MLQDIIIHIMEQYGYIGIFLLIMIENIFPPIPSEVILLFGGFMTIKSSLRVIGVIISATLGSLVGAIILYYIGKIFDKEKLIKIVSGKIGKILCLKASDIIKADEWFNKKGLKTVFFCRFIPIVRSLISIPAGMAKINMLTFLSYTFIGSLIWNTVLVLIGHYVGSKWTKILTIFDTYSTITLVILIFMFIMGVLVFYRKKKVIK